MATTLRIDFSNIQGQLTSQSMVEFGSKWNSSNDIMVILVSSKNEEDPIKIDRPQYKILSGQNRMATIQNIDFSNTKGQLTPQSEVGSGQNSKSFEIL